MKIEITKGIVAAAAAAGLLSAACASSTPAANSADHVAEGKACCKGMNECAGHGGCKTDKNECKGHNECKGQGGCNAHCPS